MAPRVSPQRPRWDQFEVVTLPIEEGGEDPEPDLVLRLELVEAPEYRFLRQVELGEPLAAEVSHRTAHVEQQDDRAVLRYCSQLSISPTSTSGAGSSSSVSGCDGLSPLALLIGSPTGTAGSRPEAEFEHLRLVLRVVHHGLPEGEGSLALYVVHPVSVEDVRRVVREERSLLRIHRHQRHLVARALVPGVCWIATVVGEDADLLTATAET